MATSKTLTPTNVTIQIPEFTDQPDQRVNSNCLDKEADAINALNTHISKHTFGTSVDLKSATLPYTIPSDGYVKYNINSGSDYLLFSLNGSQIVVPQNASYNTASLIFVRKGMTFDSLTNPSTANVISFIPFV